MTNLDPTSILRERYEVLAARRIELRAELDPLELEMARLQAGLVAMGATDGLEQVVPWVPPAEGKLRLLHQPAGDLVMVDAAIAGPRVRHPDLQQAIDNQAPSVAIPPGTKLYCGQGCINGEAGGFGDQFALRTHCKRTHDREPTEAEKVPR